MNEKDWQTLLEQLNTDQLTHLTLNGGDLFKTCDRFNTFCKALKNNKRLKSLTLNEIGGVIPCTPMLLGKILEIVANHSAMDEIKLPNNHLRFVDQDSILFKHFIACISRIKKVDLADNDLFRLNPASLQKIYQTLANKKNHRLYLARTGLETKPEWQSLQSSSELDYLLQQYKNNADSYIFLTCLLFTLSHITETHPAYNKAKNVFDQLVEQLHLRNQTTSCYACVGILPSSHPLHLKLMETLGLICLNQETIDKKIRLAQALAFFTNTTRQQQLNISPILLFQQLMNKEHSLPSSWRTLYQSDTAAFSRAYGLVADWKKHFGFDRKHPYVLCTIEQGLDIKNNLFFKLPSVNYPPSQDDCVSQPTLNLANNKAQDNFVLHRLKY